MIRPSSLPKLAQCPRYESDPISGDAAARGTRLDALVRASISGDGFPVDEVTKLNPIDMEAVMWTIQKAEELSCGASLTADEDSLRVAWQGIAGTMDLACWPMQWSADIKTGQIRDYEAQQAAYALGCMEKTGAPTWTVYLLYCDQQQVTYLSFTRELAETIVRSVVESVTNGDPARTCEYCDWCAKRFTCVTRREHLALVPVANAEQIDFAAWPSEKIRDFVLACDTVETFKDEARKTLLERCKAEKVPGVSVVTKRGTKVMPKECVIAHADSMDRVAAATLIGTISEEKARLIYPDISISDLLIETAGSTYIRVTQPKTKNKNT